MSSIGSVPRHVTAAIGSASSRMPVPALVAGALVLTGAAAMGLALLRGDEPAQPRIGSRALGTRPAGSSGATIPGAGTLGPYVALETRADRPANSATDPASFNALLRTGGAGWTAADGTISVPLPEGKTLWLFGDTILNLPDVDGTLRHGADFVRNSAVIHDGAKLTTLVTGSAQDADDFLKPVAADEWYWPQHGTVQGDELVLFMSRLHKTAHGEQGWNFETTGSDMLRLDLGDMSVTERIQLPGGDRFEWGTAVVSDDTHTYVYGFEGGDGWDRHAHVARTPKGALGDAPFEFWDGDSWTSNVNKSRSIADGVANSFSVVPTPDGRWALVSQALFFDTGLLARTANSPQGPWSEWKEIDPGPTKAPGTTSYNAQVHPTFTEDGTLLASWNMNLASGLLPTTEQLDSYRPVFRSVEWDRITDPPKQH